MRVYCLQMATLPNPPKAASRIAGPFGMLEGAIDPVPQGKSVVYTTDKANLKALAAALSKLMPK